MPTVKVGYSKTNGLSARECLVEFGPALRVNIGFDPNYVEGQIPDCPLKGEQALIDTGATFSCIDLRVATSLNLPIVDRQNIIGIGGLHEVDMHLAQIHVPDLSFTIHGMFAAVDLTGSGLTHAALIGRSFLQHVSMIYEGKTGDITVSV